MREETAVRIGASVARPDAQPSVKASSPVYLSYLDGLRALAALYVVAHHSWLQIWPIALYGIWPTGRVLYATQWLAYGHFGVTVFIVLSGFCLMLPVARGNGRLSGGALRFYGKRARRILPTYYAALALSLLLIALFIGRPTGTHWDASLPVTVRDVALHALLLQDMFSPATINHAMWSISVEWHIYFLFPLFVWLSRVGRALLLAAIGVLLYATYFVLGPQWSFVLPYGLGTIWNSSYTGFAFGYVAYFIAGMLGAICVFSRSRTAALIRNRLPGWSVAALLFVLLCALATAWGGVMKFTATQWTWLDLLVCGIAFCVLVKASLPGRNPVSALLRWRPLVWVGTFSYSLYLIHAPLIQLIWQYGINPLHLSRTASFAMLIGIGMPLMVGTAYVFHRLFERPFMNLKRVRTEPEAAGSMVEPHVTVAATP